MLLASRLPSRSNQPIPAGPADALTELPGVLGSRPFRVDAAGVIGTGWGPSRSSPVYVDAAKSIFTS